MNTYRKISRTDGEQGVALILTLLALIVLSAIAAGLIYATNTDTAINSNYRAEQEAYFAAKAGLEEARERLRPNAPDTIAGPTVTPSTTGGVMYLLNPAGNADVVQPWNTANTYFDDELCHENFYTIPANPGKGIRCTAAPTGGTWYSTVNSDEPYFNTAAALPYKWVRVTLKENGSTAPYCVDGSCASANTTTEICWDGGKQILRPSASTSCSAAGYSNILLLTSLAQTSSGARRLLSMEAAPPVSLPIQSAVYANSSANTGQALNVTGNTEPVCSKPSTYGVESGTSTVTTPGQGNVTGSPAATRNNAGWPYNLPALVTYMQSNATPINATGSGVTGTGAGGNLPPFTGPSAVLGTVPTVNPASGAVSTIPSPGSPLTYYSPGDLTLGTNATASGVNGYGVLVVNGNLTINVSNGFNFYGLIVVTGNTTIIARNNTSVNPQIHGAIIVGGTFSAPISNMSGSISLFQDACFVDKAMGQMPLAVLALRELMY
ncbi:MAG: hypothetical protein M3O09_19380 [Acidobacteriota bacterium]|nr:hypothetical protein [Acidobacteriota bacterium]